jgi:hypothetical protein
MHSVRKSLYIVGAVVAVAAVTVVGVKLSTPSEVASTPVAEQVAPQGESAIPSEQLRKMLLPASSFPEGSTIVELTFQQAEAAGYNDPPPDMVVTPARCADGLGDAVGDPARTTGWSQYVTTPSGEIVASFAASVDDGASFDGLRRSVVECSDARVELTSFGLVGNMKFTEIAGPVLFGAKTIGIQATTVFPDQTIPDGAKNIVEALNVASWYVAQGNLIMNQCKVPNSVVEDGIAEMYARAAVA